MSEPTSTTATTTTPEAEEKKPTTVVDIVFDAATDWATVGLSAGKNALEHSARALDKAAQTLERLARELGDKKAA